MYIYIIYIIYIIYSISLYTWGAWFEQDTIWRFLKMLDLQIGFPNAKMIYVLMMWG